MLAIDDLKTLLHRPKLRLLDALLMVLATFDAPCGIVQVKERAANAGYRIPAKKNLSDILGKSRGVAIRVPNEGWEITKLG